MNRRKKFLLASSVALALTLAALLVWRREPRYGGRSLTDWVVDAQAYQKLSLTHRPDYLTASNAIYQLGPVAAKTAVDWLVADARWQRNPLRPWVEKLLADRRDVPPLNRSQAAAVILRLVSPEGRSAVEPRLIEMFVSGETGFLAPNRQFYWPPSVLTNFGASTWSKVEPLLLNTNPSVRGKTIALATHWASERTVNFDVLWQCRSNAQGWDEDAVNILLFQQKADPNRLADAIGSSFLSGRDWAGGEQHMAEHRAHMLETLGMAGRRYLKAGLTNESAAVRSVSRRFLDR